MAANTVSSLNDAMRLKRIRGDSQAQCGRDWKRKSLTPLFLRIVPRGCYRLSVSGGAIMQAPALLHLWLEAVARLEAFHLSASC